MTAICHDIPIGAMNVRQLKNTLNSIQTGWIKCRGWEIHGMTDALLCIASQVGILASRAMPANIIDDDESVEPVYGNNTLNTVTKKETRRCINVLMVLFRSIHIHNLCQSPVEHDYDKICTIQRHHTLAGEDDFHSLSMYWDLPAAAVLNYTHDFAGMYSNVSQV